MQTYCLHKFVCFMAKEQEKIVVTGARVNNLKNVSLEMPRESLVVITGLSGSGKSSLAFDTIYAEGQRRYVESLSSYARQFLGQMDKPDVDSIDGLSPAISIDQKTTSKNPRSTVGTVTEIYDYLRLLWARVGVPHCPKCGKEIRRQTIDQIVDRVEALGEGTRFIVLSPVIRGKKGEHQKIFEDARKSGYVRARVDGITYDLSEEIKLEKNFKHNIYVVVDRLKIRDEQRSRIYDSIETAAKLGEGKIYVDINGERLMFSEHYKCPECGFAVSNLEPTLFSFNAPLGACDCCKGLGFISSIDIDLLVTDENLSIEKGAIRYLKNIIFTDNIEWQTYRTLFEYYHIDLFKPYKDLTDEQKDIIFNGSKEPIKYEIHSTGGISMRKNKVIEGLGTLISRRYAETSSSMQREYYGSYMQETLCPTCHGKRLSEIALSVKIGGKNIHEFTEMSIDNALDFINNLKLSILEQKIANLVLKEIKNRLLFLKEVGLEYLTLSRKAGTLSGGEAQRIRLATQIGSQLTGVLYVLDEPSIGLHQRDNDKLLATLKKLRDLGNTLIVVEHDEEIMRECDYLVDIGPYAGVHGGEVVAKGTPEEFKEFTNSITSDYLYGRRKIEIPKINIKEICFIFRSSFISIQY